MTINSTLLHKGCAVWEVRSSVRFLYQNWLHGLGDGLYLRQRQRHSAGQFRDFYIMYVLVIRFTSTDVIVYFFRNRYLSIQNTDSNSSLVLYPSPVYILVNIRWGMLKFTINLHYSYIVSKWFRVGVGWAFVTLCLGDNAGECHAFFVININIVSKACF